MPSGLGESPGGYGSTPGGYGGGSRDNNTSFGSYTEDNGYGGYNTVNVSDYGMSPNDSGYGYNPDYGGMGPSQNWTGGFSFANDFADYAAQPSYSVDNVFGDTSPNVTPAWQGMVNLPQIKGPTSTNEGEPGFWNSEFGKKLKQFGLFALRVHPATRTPMAIYGALDSLFGGKPSQGMGQIVGMATKNPLLGGAVQLGMDAFSGKPVGGQLGSTLGSMAGGATGGPVGAALGGMAGGAIGQGYDQGRTGPAPASQAGNQDRRPGDPLGAGLTSLAALWMANKQNKTAQQYREQQAQQAQTLQQMFAQQQAQMPKPPGMRSPNLGSVRAQMESMFGAGSKTAATLRTQLERKDAASGRRSQYGPREVELLARLAQLRAQAEPSYMNAEIAAANSANQHAAQMYSTQQQAYNNYIQNMLRGQELGGGNQSAAYQAQQAADLARQQQLAAILYGARETGLFDAAANWWGS